MRKIPPELRQCALAAYKTGRYTQLHLADIFGVTRKTINNWVRIERTESRNTPLPKGHRRQSFSEEDKQRLILLVSERPELTLEQLRELMGKDCTHPTVHNALQRLGFFLKNSPGQRTRP
jgi:transposase